ncbi:MAG: hypothetical protein ABF868_05395 [Sporolactobacillus sp.]
MFQDTLACPANHQTLSETKAAAAMDEIMEGKAGESQITAFLAMLSLRGESADELTGDDGMDELTIAGRFHHFLT